MKKPPLAAERVKAFLRQQRDDLQAQNICRSKVVLIDRILMRNEAALDDAWAGLIASCPEGHPPGMTWERWQLVLDRLLDVALDYTPEKIERSRYAKDRIAELNLEIASRAGELAKLLRTRNALRAHGDFTLPNDHTPLDLMQRAAELSEHDHTAYLYDRHIAPTLEDLDRRFDLKYWPTTADFLDALAEAQHLDEPEAQDSLTAAALQVREASARDFMRAVDEALDALSPSYYAGRKVELPHRTYATLCDVLLDHRDGTISDKSVKTYRAHEKKRKARG